MVFLLITVVSVRSAQLISGSNGRLPLVRASKSSKTTDKLLLFVQCLYSDSWNFTVQSVNKVSARLASVFIECSKWAVNWFLIRWTFPMVAVRWVSSLRFKIKLHVEVMRLKFKLTLRSFFVVEIFVILTL